MQRMYFADTYASDIGFRQYYVDVSSEDAYDELTDLPICHVL